MTTRAGKWLQTPVWKLPKWGWIAAAIAVAVLASAIVISVGGSNNPTVQQQPAVPAAASTSAAEPAAPVAAVQQPAAPAAPLSPEAANFTRGVYTSANPNATDGAEVVASFLNFLIAGKVDEAMRFIQDPKEPSVLSFVSTALESKRDGSMLPIKINNLYDISDRKRAVEVRDGAPTHAGREYITSLLMGESGKQQINFHLKKTQDGKWVITRFTQSK